MIPSRPPPPIRSPRSCRAAAAALGALCVVLASCTTPPPPPQQPTSEAATRAERSRTARLEHEIERLRVDLRQAEAAMLATDSELSTGRNRASAVSLLVEARIALEQAERSAPWKLAAIEEGRHKLAEGERQLKAGRPPAAVYFASRAQHIADSLNAEARIVEQSPDALFVKAEHLNLRAGPSTDETILVVLLRGTPIFAQHRLMDWLQVRTLDGEVGWVYSSLLSER